MEEKKKIKISLSTVLLLIAIVLIIVMGLFIYDLKKDRITNIQQPINTSNDNTNSLLKNNSYNEDDAMTDKENEFFGLFKSSDGVYKYIFFPNGEMSFINDNSDSTNKIWVGKYSIEDDTLFYTFNDLEWYEFNSQVGRK